MQGWELCEFIGTWFIKVFNQRYVIRVQNQELEWTGFMVLKEGKCSQWYNVIWLPLLLTEINVLTKSTSLAWASLQRDSRNVRVGALFHSSDKGVLLGAQASLVFHSSEKAVCMKSFPNFHFFESLQIWLVLQHLTNTLSFPYYILMEIAKI